MNFVRCASYLLLAACVLNAVPAAAQTAEEFRALADRAEIEELVVRYAMALDTLDAEAYANVFTEDAVFDVTGTVYRGREAIRGIVTGLQESRERALAEGAPVIPLYHVMSNTLIEIVDDDEARHTSYAQTVRLGDDARFIIGFMGRYEDVVVKRDGRWQIQSRRLVSFLE